MKEPSAIGAFQIEALAAGVPVVQPRLGGFAELIESTCGGILYEPNDAETLASKLEGLLLDPTRAKELGECGRGVVFERYNNMVMAEEIVKIYESI
jgi:glycosyltransferase involved in cell wall biosynthesis